MLKKLAVPLVKVRRGGAVQDISALHLVLGDIVLLTAEDIVPADCRVLASAGLRTQEAALTGVAEPVDKDPKTLPGAADLMLSHRRNMVYMGTVVTAGRGQAVVTATGMHTELGRITAPIQTVAPEPTPLQKRLDQLGRGLAVASVALVGLIMPALASALPRLLPLYGLGSRTSTQEIVQTQCHMHCCRAEAGCAPIGSCTISE